MNQKRAIKTRNYRIGIYFALLSIAIVGVAVYTILDRLTQEALAVLAGATCGVLAAIPTSLLIVVVSRRLPAQAGERPKQAQQPQPPAYAGRQQGTYPPVVVIAPQGTQQHQLPGWPGWGARGIMDPPAERSFTVVGGDLDD